MNKTGKFDAKTVNVAIMTIIVIAALLSIYAAVVPTGQSAGDDLADSGQCTSQGGYWNDTQATCYNTSDINAQAEQAFREVPIGNLFGGNGIVFLLLMVALFILIVRDSKLKK